VRLHSQKPAPKKISVAAAEAFEELVRNSNVVVGEEGWGWREDLCGNDQPLVDEFKKHWQGVLGDQIGVQELLQAIPALVEGNPFETEASSKEGVTCIEDVKAFKASLEVSEEATPLVEWGDLPVAKF